LPLGVLAEETLGANLASGAATGLILALALIINALTVSHGTAAVAIGDAITAANGSVLQGAGAVAKEGLTGAHGVSRRTLAIGKQTELALGTGQSSNTTTGLLFAFAGVDDVLARARGCTTIAVGHPIAAADGTIEEVARLGQGLTGAHSVCLRTLAVVELAILTSGAGNIKVAATGGIPGFATLAKMGNVLPGTVGCTTVAVGGAVAAADRGVVGGADLWKRLARARDSSFGALTLIELAKCAVRAAVVVAVAHDGVHRTGSELPAAGDQHNESKHSQVSCTLCFRHYPSP
jgi:hypothetical protein